MEIVKNKINILIIVIFLNVIIISDIN